MRAFVTGGTGFLGRRVVRRLLERGDQVLALAREGSRADELKAAGAEVVVGDLGSLDPSILEQAGSCDVVYHVGARVVSHGDWDEFFRVNVEATQRLMDAAIAGGARFVHVSSLGIFEIDREGIVVTEESDYDHQPMLRGYYTRSKIDADRLVCSAARAGKNVVVVRPGLLYGPDHPQQAVFLGRVKKFLRPDLLLVVSSPGYRVPLTYIENAADAVVAAGVVEGVAGSIFNVVDNPDLTQAEYFRALARARGDRLRVMYVPVTLLAPAVNAVNFAHKLVKRRPWSVAYQLLRSERSARYATDAAATRLAWSPRVDLDRSLQESLRKPA
ncbi:MAG TPA: NAD-dependent epimerase/dehydratase family protein [Candidatus Limnocylindrales bacterium]|nr:NAD-dependent epimerase/dehydratase family protein [Candidatus Limnocylindrales bacterium]